MTSDSNVILLETWRKALRATHSGDPPSGGPIDPTTALKHAMYGIYIVMKSRLGPEDQEFVDQALLEFAQDPRTGEQQRNIYLDLLGLIEVPTPDAE